MRPGPSNPMCRVTRTLTIARLVGITLVVVVGWVAVAAAQTMAIGPAQLLYDDAQMPFTMDGTLATLKRDATTQFFWHTYGVTTTKWIGTPTSPFQTFVGTVSWNAVPSGTVPWLMSIYSISATELLGFVHKEAVQPDGTPIGPPFAISLAYSTDKGNTWRYLGEIVRPQNTNNNSGGAPYLVVGPYFYVYFNDGTVTVARALVADVITAARAGTSFKWNKLVGGTFSGDGFASRGDNIIPPNVAGGGFFSHGDATYNATLNKYLLVLDSQAGGKLIMAQSSDGVSWPAADIRVIDNTTCSTVDGVPGTCQPATGAGFLCQTYASLVDEGISSEDSHVVGNTFSIIFPRKDLGNYEYDVLYRRQVTIGGGALPAAPLNLRLNP